MVSQKTKQQHLMKNLILFALLLSQVCFAQKYYTKTGLTEFSASVQAFEEVAAKNNSSSAVLKTETGDFAALLFIKGFRFKVALMEEHFNENYMDSDQFPKATFKGKLLGFNNNNLSDTSTEVPLEGVLTVRGVEKDIKTIAQLSKKDDKLILKTTFKVTPGDFNIKIPSIVRKKIAEEIIITAHYELIKK